MGKKSRNSKKDKDVEESQAQDADGMSTQERLYLESLERAIASPGRSPYIQRQGKGRQPETPSAVEPVFDSGPQSAKQQPKAQSPPRTTRAKPATAQTSLETEDGRVRLGADGVYEIALDIPSADLERLEDDAQRAPARKPSKKETPPRPPEPEQQLPRDEEIAPTADLFQPGTIVLWNDGQLGIYKRHVETKGYDLLYVVQPDGRLEPKGLCLHAYDPQRVGFLSQGIFQWMEKTMRWERDALVWHLDNPADAAKLPIVRDAPPSFEPQPPPKQSPDTPNGHPLARGQTFTITVGGHRWNAVYWGRDQIGTVVAHNTNRAWVLMHLDFKRFASTLQLGDVLPEQQIEEIERTAEAQD